MKNKSMFSDINSTKTEGVLVSVSTAYVIEQSSPHLDHFMFAYQITILNESSDTVQLLRRRWLIKDGYGVVRVVEGEGVIGRQPILKPGEEHEYISGCEFTTPIGKMSGHYTMVRHSDGTEFDVRIPDFVMVAPFTLN
jgi:ApaG protein